MVKFASTLALAAALALAGCGGEQAESQPGPPPTPGPAPTVDRPVELGGSPSAVVAALGSVWVADNLRGRVLRVDPVSGDLESVSVKPAPIAIAAGEDAVWVASAGGAIQRIDADTLATTRASAPVTGAAGIAVGEGSVWVTSATDGTVTRFDETTASQEGDAIAVGPQPTDIAVGAGAVWVASSAQMSGTVTRIDAETGEAAEPIEAAEGQIFALTYGEDGVWVAGSDALRGDLIDIVRIDPDSSEVEGAFVRLERPGLPVRLAAGEGFVWVAQSGGDPLEADSPGTVVRIDPEERRLVGGAAEVGRGPTGVSVGEGGVWVATGGDGAVVRVQGE